MNSSNISINYYTEPLFTFHLDQYPDDELSHKAFFMYHGTYIECLPHIIEEGFRRSDYREDRMLGTGIYASRDPRKTLRYGPVTLKLVGYTGKVQVVPRQEHLRQWSWQNTHDAAWVPVNCGMVDSNREETCFREPWQIKILGISRGYELLPPFLRAVFPQVYENEITPLEIYLIKGFKREIQKIVKHTNGLLMIQMTSADLKITKEYV